jgi:hypothetical protein
MCVSKLSELSHQQQITLRMRSILILGGRSDFAGVVLDELAAVEGKCASGPPVPYEAIK